MPCRRTRPTQRTLAETVARRLCRYRAKAGEVSASLLKGYRQNVGEWIGLLGRANGIRPTGNRARPRHGLANCRNPTQTRRARRCRRARPQRSTAISPPFARSIIGRHRPTHTANIAREAKGPKSDQGWCIGVFDHATGRTIASAWQRVMRYWPPSAIAPSCRSFSRRPSVA
jgi:hypothetical protein